MGTRVALLAALLATLVALPARADLRSDAMRLLAHRVRESGAEPKNVAISGVTVAGNQALLSWDSGKQRGVMGLMVSADRWWDALDMTASQALSGCWEGERAYPLVDAIPFPAASVPPQSLLPPTSQTLAELGLSKALIEAAAAQNADVRTANGDAAKAQCKTPLYHLPANAGVRSAGAALHPPIRAFTSGYDITITYARNDAAPGVKFTQLFARAPTSAEFALSHPPAPGFGGPDAVCFFDIAIGGSKTVTFEPGTTIDIWFPFVLDDQLRYNLSFFSAEKPSGMIFGTVFDNTLRFVLPKFAIDPGAPMMAEIDGDPKGSS